MTPKEHISENFALKGFTSIQIGFYFLLASYSIKIILEGFLIDDNPMGMMSAEIIEYLIGGIGVFLFLFSSFALFFSAKRRAKKQELPLWNSLSKRIFYKYMASFLVLFIALIFLMKQGFIYFITSVFLFFYGANLLFVSKENNQNIRIISGICLLLAMICFLIPSYWYASITILGIAHITFGIVVKN